MRKSRPLARFEDHSLALFAALVLCSGGAVAQSRGVAGGDALMLQVQAPVSTPAAQDTALQRADAAFSRADANGDGRLSREEAQRLPAVAERFDEIDANGDRLLSREEFHRGIGY